MRSSVLGSLSPSCAVRRMVSAIDCTAAEDTGCGSAATAPSIAVFMTSMVSGGNDALGKSFMASTLRFRTHLTALVRREPVQQVGQVRRQRQAVGIQRDAKPVADLPADGGVMNAVDLDVA